MKHILHFAEGQCHRKVLEGSKCRQKPWLWKQKAIRFLYDHSFIYPSMYFSNQNLTASDLTDWKENGRIRPIKVAKNSPGLGEATHDRQDNQDETTGKHRQRGQGNAGENNQVQD